jgi:hypothetical protein
VKERAEIFKEEGRGLREKGRGGKREVRLRLYKEEGREFEA